MPVKKILIIGEFTSEIHEIALSDAFTEFGIHVERYKTSHCLIQNNYLLKKLANLQVKLGFGPYIFIVNFFLACKIYFGEFDLIFFYRPTIINKYNFYLASKRSITFLYNNDDPFSSAYGKNIWKKYFYGLKFSDHIFYYREKNKEDLKLIGFENTSLLRSYYLKKRNFIIENLTKNKYTADVSFIGHFENDGRDLILKNLIEKGIKLKIFGPEWHRSKYYNFYKQHMGEIYPLGADYNLAINSCKICLVFFSKLNNDKYTRRVFEIPAAKTMMMSEATETMEELFLADHEAVYFTNPNELFEKLNFYLSNPDLINKIAQNGYTRLMSSGHEIQDRAKQILKTYESIMKS